MPRIDATPLLAAERQEPMTAAEHAAARGLAAEYARDVPRTCTGTHQWNVQTRRYELLGHVSVCPWHSAAAAPEGPA